MRILHTADWHLGKNLEGISRIEEQKKFLEDFVNIVNEEKIDLVIIAGDIFDSSNPKAAAEKMFYDTLKKLTYNEDRAVLVISGNHDSPERLQAPSKLAMEFGIIIYSSPLEIIEKGFYGKNEVIESKKGFIKMKIKDETISIIALPYPSEKTLNEVLYDDMNGDEENIKSYNDRIKDIFSSLEENFSDDTINIAVSHIFTLGSIEGGSERSIQLGGSYIVNGDSLPKKAQYIALGHIHKMQKVKGTNGRARYAGSPLQYNKKEINYDKGCYVIDLEKGLEPKIEVHKFNIYKPIEIVRCKGIEDAIEKCRKRADEESYIYLEIETDTYINQEDIKLLRGLKKDIVEIMPIIKKKDSLETALSDINDKSFEELFREFYKKNNEVEPTDELVNTILDIMREV